jgi:hypothetical protein
METDQPYHLRQDPDTGAVHRHTGTLADCAHSVCVRRTDELYVQVARRTGSAPRAGEPVRDSVLDWAAVTWVLAMTGPWIVLLWGMGSWRSALSIDLLVTLALMLVSLQRSTKQR